MLAVNELPATQVNAWNAIRSSGALGRYQWMVYDYLSRHPGVTRNEIDHALAPGLPNPPFSRRLVELERAGVICRLGEKDGKDRWYATTATTVDRAAMKAPKKSNEAAVIEKIREILQDRSGALFPDPRVTRIKLLLEETEASQ